MERDPITVRNAQGAAHDNDDTLTPRGPHER